MATIRHTKSYTTEPRPSGNKVIAHVCKDLGSLEKGGVVAISSIAISSKGIYIGPPSSEVVQNL